MKKYDAGSHSVTAGIWFAVPTSIMLSIEDIDTWWLSYLMLFVAMLLYSVSFYALTQAIGAKILDGNVKAAQEALIRQAFQQSKNNWRDER